MKKIIAFVVLLVIVSSGIVLFIYPKYGNIFTKNSVNNSSEKVINTENPSLPKESVFGKLINDESKWKVLKIKDMAVKYPSEWPTVDQAAITSTPFGFGAQITSSDNTTRIVVLTDLNSNSSEEELDEFLNSLISLGGKIISVDGNKASQSTVTPYPGNETRKVITSYINAPDKKSQYSLSIENTSGMSDETLKNLFESVISRIRF